MPQFASLSDRCSPAVCTSPGGSSSCPPSASLLEVVLPGWKWPFLDCFQCFAALETVKTECASYCTPAPGCESPLWLELETLVHSLWSNEVAARMAKACLGAEAQEGPSEQQSCWRRCMESRNKGAGCSTKRKHGLCHTVLGNSTHLTKPSARRCRDGFSPCRNAQLYSLRAILSLHGDGCGHTRYFNFTALPSVHKTAQGAAVDSSVCHRRWIS